MQKGVATSSTKVASVLAPSPSYSSAQQVFTQVRVIRFMPIEVMVTMEAQHTISCLRFLQYMNSGQSLELCQHLKRGDEYETNPL